jgi:hypothetical protein
MVASAIKEGNFDLKRSALALISQLINGDSYPFLQHLIRQKRMFACGVEMLESGIVPLQRDYLSLIDRMLRSVTHLGSLRTMLVKRIDDAGLGIAMEAQFWHADRDIGDLARAACVKLEDCRMQTTLFPQFQRFGNRARLPGAELDDSLMDSD